MNINTNDSKSMFAFSNPVLKESRFYENDKYDSDNVSDKPKSMKIRGTLSNLRSDDSGYTHAMSTLTVTNLDEKGGFNEKLYPYLISITYGAEFKWPSSLDDKDVESFLKFNVPSILLSYIRPQVSNLIGASKFDRLDIPFIDFTTQIDE